MGGEVPDKKLEPPVEAPATSETPEAQAEREAAEKARAEKLQKLMDGTEEQRAADKKEADTMIEEFMHEDEASTAKTESTQEKPEGGIFNTISGGLASAMEPMVSNMLARTAERLQKDGTGSWQEALSDTFLKALVQISLFLNPKAPWAEKLFADAKTKDLFAKGLGMQLARDPEGNYSCSFDATLQPETLPCSPANELFANYLGEGTLPELKRGQTIADLKNALTGVASDSPEKAMADLMLENINKLGLDEETPLGKAFKSGFDANLEGRLATLTGGEQSLVTSSLARHEEMKQVETEATAITEALADAQLTKESPVDKDLLEKIISIPDSTSPEIQSIKLFAAMLLLGGPEIDAAATKTIIEKAGAETLWREHLGLATPPTTPPGDLLSEIKAKIPAGVNTFLGNMKGDPKPTLLDFVLASQTTPATV